MLVEDGAGGTSGVRGLANSMQRYDRDRNGTCVSCDFLQQSCCDSKVDDKF